MRKLKGILIDPEKRTIEYVEYDDTLEAIYKLLDVELISSAYVPHLVNVGDNLYVDDEGLLTNPNHFFKLEDNSQPLAGRGLIVGPENAAGEGSDCKTTLKQVDHMIVWMIMDDVRGDQS